jgi:hypothetical protein
MNHGGSLNQRKQNGNATRQSPFCFFYFSGEASMLNSVLGCNGNKPGDDPYTIKKGANGTSS